MACDVVDLHEFYGTSLGQMATRLIRRRLRRIWPTLEGQCVLGFGYAVPYLRPFMEEAERVLAIMPAAQGVMRWPPGEPSLVALADEAELPLPDLSLDRVLLVHALEHSEQVRGMLREILEGHARRRAPRRRGTEPARHLGAARAHALRPRAPLHARPALARAARQHVHADAVGECAFHAALAPAPPACLGAGLGGGGARWLESFAGVVMIEASKQIYGGALAHAERKRRRVYLPIPGETGIDFRAFVIPLPARRERASIGLDRKRPSRFDLAAFPATDVRPRSASGRVLPEHAPQWSSRVPQLGDSAGA